MLQILVSAACISTAEAEVSFHAAPVTAHCHNVSMTDIQASNANENHASSCTHCDTPDLAVSAYAPVMSDAVAVLLAVIVFPQIAELGMAQRTSVAEAASPPYSSTLLYQTTRRILI